MQEDIKLHFNQDCYYGKSTRNSSAYLVFHIRDGDAKISGSMVFAATKPFEKWNELKLEQTNINDVNKFVVHGITDDVQRQTLLILMEDIKEVGHTFIFN